MARRGVSAAERRRIAEALARAAMSSEREAVRIVREVYERIKDLPPDEAIRVLRESLGATSTRLAESVIASYRSAARVGARRSVISAGWKGAADALARRYATSGGIQVSASIHQRGAETLRGMERALADALRFGRGAVETARRLRDYTGAIPETELTKLLADLKAKARAAIAASGDPRALEAFRASRATIDRYAARLQRSEYGMGAGTEHAIGAIERAVKRNNDAAVEKAIHWWSYDKQAYRLRVIARTEAARGYNDGFIANADVPWVVGFQWNVETGIDRETDICDVHAGANIYGLGAGVYPFDKVPELPAHPNCNCFLTEVIDESITEDDERPPAPPQREGATADWLRSQPVSTQREILGAGDYEAFRRSGGREAPAWLRV